jgi:hypothetical protein
MGQRIERVGVLGAGLMGHGIAQVAAQAGYEVVLRELDEATLGKGLAKIEKQLARAVEKGRSSQADAGAQRVRINGTTHYRELADCDLVIEAITESLPLKLEMWREVDEIVKPEQPPGVADDGQQRRADHPRRPEAGAGAARQPHADAHRRDAEPAAGLLHEPPAKLALALAQRERNRRRADRQVRPQRIEVAARSRAVGAADALLHLIGRQPPGERVLAQLVDHLLAVGIGDTQLRGVAHALNVPRYSERFSAGASPE